MRRALITSVWAAVLLVPTLALAQENGDTGIVMGYPASFGIIWHGSDKVAIRPEISFSHNTSDSESGSSQTEGSSTTTNVGASVLFYLQKWDRVQTYVAPRYAYTRTDTESESTGLGSGRSESKANTHTFAGHFGVQYAPHQRFSIFGEVGAGVAHTSGRLSNVSESTSTTFNTRTGVGVILYF